MAKMHDSKPRAAAKPPRKGKTMNYLVEDHTKQGKVFATIEEANAYANYCIRNSGYVWRVIETDREVTYTYDIKKQ